MTKTLLLTALLLLMAMAILADGLPSRTPPSYTFTRTPITLMASYYDYMIGSYNNLPLQVLPNGGGYIMTYQGMIGPATQRRVFYSWVDASGNTTLSSYLNQYGTNREGYPAVAVDPISGAVLYAWHEAYQSTEVLDVRFVADAFTAGLPESFGSYQTAIDNPISITSPEGYTTDDNQFLWPSLAIGPSPLPDKRRVYVLARNVQNTTTTDSENAYLAYADFDIGDLEPGNLLTWTYRSVPRLDTWHHDPLISRNIHLSLACDQSGRVYLCGNHQAYYTGGSANFPEADIDIFYCENYGTGTWQDLHFYSDLPSWNPNTAATDTTGYFRTDEGLPYDDSGLKWRIASTDHFNISFDHEGRVHIPGLWQFIDGDPFHGYGYREMNTIKEAIFDPITQQLIVKEIYPQKHPDDTCNSCYQPWDREAPWGVEDGYTNTPEGDAPIIHKDWNYCLWDEEGPPAGNMMFHSNNLRITNANGQGMMAMLWQNSMRAREYYYYDNPAYAAFHHGSEIMISVSPDNGTSWSEPISLNQVETPEMAGILPLWAYCAGQVIYTGENSGHSVGKLGLMFYDDYDWIPEELPPHIAVTNLGEAVMFAELQITFPLPAAIDDQQQAPAMHCLGQNYPNPFSASTTIDITLKRSEPISLDIYNIKGQFVKCIYSGTAAKGTTKLSWDGTDNHNHHVASGIYLAKLSRQGKHETMRMLLLTRSDF